MRINPIDLVQSFAAALPVVSLTLVGIAVFCSRLKQLVWKPKRTGRRRRFGICAANAALGLSFLPFAAIYRPRMIEIAKTQIRQQEDVDEEDNGGPDSHLKHLLRQLRRIRRGETVDTLFVRLK
jgi:hypothetical protein